MLFHLNNKNLSIVSSHVDANLKLASTVIQNKKKHFLPRAVSKNNFNNCVFLSHRKTFWTSLNRPYERAVIPQPLEIDYNLLIPTVRNSAFNLSTAIKFHRLVQLRDLPIHFDLARRRFLRYRAAFYGVQYNTNLFSYNLWLTMGLKKNIAVPWGLYFYTPWIRKNYLANIYKKSWGSYAFTVRNSFRKVNLNIQSGNALTFYLPTNFSRYLTDRCIWNLRKRFIAHRACRLYEDDMNFEISTYQAWCDFYDFRKRAIWFWTADNAFFRDPTFYITSYDPTILLSPRKHLMFKLRLAMIAKFHRSWRLFNSWNNVSFTVSTNNVLFQFNNYIKNIFINSVSNYCSCTISNMQLFTLLIFKYIYFVNNVPYSFLNMISNLKRFFKQFFLFSLRGHLPILKLFFKKNIRKNSSDIKISINKLLNTNFNIRKSTTVFKNRWKIICFNFSSIFKNWWKKRKSVWSKNIVLNELMFISNLMAILDFV